MEERLIAAGIACVIAAIVGGGLEAFGIKVPLLKSRPRQWTLGLFGVLLIAVAARDHLPCSLTLSCEGGNGNGIACFPDVPESLTVSVETGAIDRQIIGPHQDKSAPAVVLFTKNDERIGAMKFRFFPQDSMFKLQAVVEADCKPTQNFRNATRDGDPHVLQNWDELALRLGDADYIASLEFSENTVSVDFR